MFWFEKFPWEEQVQNVHNNEIYSQKIIFYREQSYTHSHVFFLIFLLI